MATPEERFRAFDFEQDPRWREYLNQVTFPPGRDDLIKKYQARWFKREIDPDLDVDAVTPQPPTRPAEAPRPSPAPTPPPASRPSSASAAPQPTQTTSKPSSTSTRNTTTTTSTNAQPRLMDVLLLVAHMVIVIAALLAVQPLDPYLSRAAYMHFLRSSLFANGVRLVRKVGRPPLLNLKSWLGRATASSEFLFLIAPVMLKDHPGAWIGILPGAIIALYHAIAGLQARFGASVPLLRQAHSWLASRQGDALRLATLLEILTWPSLVLCIPRQGLNAAFKVFMYGNQLRGRYWGPESRQQHVEAWSRLGMMAQPLIMRFAPLGRAVAAGQAWFEAAGQRAQATPHQD